MLLFFVLNKYNIPYHDNKASIFIEQRFLSAMSGSNLQSDRNVPAGDNFVKIDVNNFPVLTLDKERN